MMKIHKRTHTIFSIVCLLALHGMLLAGCGLSGKNNIVGRWELEDRSDFFIYEFYQDGSGVLFRSPYDAVAFTYTFEQEGGVLKVIPGDGRTLISTVTFDSDDAISLLQSGLRNPMKYVRKPIPKVPGLARASLSLALKMKGITEAFSIIEDRQIQDRDKELSGYQVLALTDIELIVGVEPEEWLVTIQLNGEDQPRQYLLVKSDERWGVMQLTKPE